MLLFLALMELLCFGPIIRQVGFYLDDWSMLSTATFGSSGFVSTLVNLFFDPQKIIRPVQAPYFAVLYSLFQLKPLGYHIVNCLVEVAAAAFVYLCLVKLSANRKAALAAGTLFLLMPTHDSTHYWVLCSSVTFSAALYLASLYSTLSSLAHGGIKKMGLLALGTALFAASLFNYESMMPLLTTSVVSVFFAARRNEGLRKALVQAVRAGILLTAVVAALYVYTRILVPMIGNGYLHGIVIEPKLILNTLYEGIRIHLPFTALPFFFSQAVQILSEPVSALLMVAFGLPVLAVFCSWKRPSMADTPGIERDLVIIGCVTFLASYLIFGLNPEYTPTYLTLVNRVNMGASIGLAFIFAAVMVFLTRKPQLWRSFKYRLLIGLILSSSVTFFMASNWAMARPWMASWVVQARLFKYLQANAPDFNSGQELLLVNCPRYVMWSPVFDGTWDFQNMARLAVKSQSLKGGVVSDRLVMKRDRIEDRSRGFLCGTYSFDRLFAFVAPEPDVIEAHSPQRFMDIVKQRGFGFDLDAAVLDKWKAELNDSAEDEN